MTGFRDLEWVGFRARSPSGTGAADVGAYGVRPPVPDGPCDVVVPRRAAALAAAAAGRRAGVHGALMADNNPFTDPAAVHRRDGPQAGRLSGLGVVVPAPTAAIGPRSACRKTCINCGAGAAASP